MGPGPRFGRALGSRATPRKLAGGGLPRYYPLSLPWTPRTGLIRCHSILHITIRVPTRKHTLPAA